MSLDPVSERKLSLANSASSGDRAVVQPVLSGKPLAFRDGPLMREIEDGIERRNPAGYDQAMALLPDLQALAEEEGSQDDFSSRVRAIQARHEKKSKFIERLNKLGRGDGERTD